MVEIGGDGLPEPLGLTLAGDGANVAVATRHATAVFLCVFDADGATEIARLALPARTGDIVHGHIAGLKVGDRYGLRAAGPFEPERGHRFDVEKLLVDPYATRLDRPFRWAPDLSRPGDTAGLVPLAVVEEATPALSPRRPRVPWDRTIIYELSVKGFTARHPDVPEAVRGTFAGLAHPAAIGHLKDLGVTTVELMPAMAWVDERHLPPLGLANAWGYNPVALMAPDPRLAPGGWDEVRAAVAALQEAGLEVILDVVLNHTGEGDQLGPTLSLRGLDNASYYRLRPDDPALYIDDAGCGNVLALDRPMVLRLAMDALRTWAQRAGLDGFRFDLATTLGRRENGFDPSAPLLAAIAQDPVLRDLRLVAEPWDIGPGGYQTGAFPAAWGEWNDRYRDDVRRFWRGDHGLAGALATRIAGSQDLFGRKGRPSRGINFVTAHDGFTLADLVSFEHKRNHGNGEGNRDGTDANFSWNHGVEGDTAEPAVQAARRRDQRALLATLLLSRGTPMLSMGAESGHSQRGNNNAYAQDNPTGWLDWGKPDHALAGHAARVVALRLAHPALTADRFLTGRPDASTGFPDVTWLRHDGGPMGDGDWNDPGRQLLALVLAAPDGDRIDRVMLVFHRGHSPDAVVLPRSREGHGWRLVLDSAREDAPEAGLHAGGDRLDVPARAVLLLAEEAEPRGDPRRTASPATLDRLARAAGIAPDWWEETGVHHVVGEDTVRALLAAMGLDVSGEGAARDALEALAQRLDRRALPQALAAEEGRPIQVRVAPGAGRLLVRDVSGQVRPAPLLATEGPEHRPGADGRLVAAHRVTLAPLTVGHYQLLVDRRPEEACRLIVAPRRCWSVPVQAGRFGVAAHLYAVRRDGDQGIGDFTTLGDLGALAGEAGASTLGLNPLHMLFPSDRERASPYHPSDRRFLDPFSIDVASLGDADPARAAIAVLAAQGQDLLRLRGVPAVDYPAVWSLKREALDAAWRGFRSGGAAPAAADFAAFRAAGGETLDRFCRYQALVEAGIDPWSARAAVAEMPDERLAHHAWLQWVADRQLGRAARRAGEAGLAIGFYRDLAVGAAPDGAEIWSQPDAFARGASIGAPPDLFSADGQVWNLPPPVPLSQRAEGAAGFGRLLAANMRHAGALRIDHVMGLTRLFWVPDGARGAQGAYVAAPLDILLAELRLQSHLHRCVVVGEDLGTVPDGLRERLDEAGVLSYRVLWFERDGAGFKPPETWPAQAAACVSTHDLPTLQGWWAGADIDEREMLGSLTREEAAAARDRRSAERDLLVRSLSDVGLLGLDDTAPRNDDALPDDVVQAIHSFVARSPSRLVLAQLDDVLGETVAVNLPGTDRERPNWRRRQGRPLSPDLGQLLATLRQAMGPNGQA